MAAIGIRVTPNEIFYSIVDEEGDGYSIISISSIKIPKALDNPCRLSYVRNILSTIIKQYKINKAGIKLIEGNARTKVNSSTSFRLNLEGVILELFANSSIEKYLLGVAPNISAILKLKSKPVKEMAEDLGIDDSDKTDEGRKLKDENKESLVVAVAALNQR
ncbi:hypothetical protein [Caloranaerobacter ferrireducens]|uniref:hypothetical protein n=1 Tax=Caloranaerobacter ferrireducens TaxID=1323370 RepID=UPI00084DD219|nr:hypothetical protein [Caloranaerobacter ferrireducens]